MGISSLSTFLEAVLHTVFGLLISPSSPVWLATIHLSLRQRSCLSPDLSFKYEILVSLHKALQLTYSTPINMWSSSGILNLGQQVEKESNMELKIRVKWLAWLLHFPSTLSCAQREEVWLATFQFRANGGLVVKQSNICHLYLQLEAEKHEKKTQDVLVLAEHFRSGPNLQRSGKVDGISNL